MKNIRPIEDESRPKVYIETYGCQMNVNDSEVILSILQDDGYALTEDIGKADLILANTCSIRDNAEQRIWGRLEQFRLQKKRRPGVLVGIVGCMAERLKDKLLDRHIVDAALEEIDGASAGSRMEKVLEVKFRSLARQSEAVKSSSASGKNARAGGYGAQEYGSGDRGRCYELKMKMLRFALGRGYGYEEAAPVIERLISGS